MYGTFARFRVKPGRMAELLDYESAMMKPGLRGFVAEFTLNTDKDPEICYELIIFESKEAYEEAAQISGQDERYRQFLDLLNGPPERHDGVIIHAIPDPRG